MNMKAVVILTSLFLAACGSTGIVKLEKNKYMISQKNAKFGFVSAADEKAHVYKTWHQKIG